MDELTTSEENIAMHNYQPKAIAFQFSIADQAIDALMSDAACGRRYLLNTRARRPTTYE